MAQNIDFRLEPGARHALIGPNGAGKTTFVNLLTGALHPSCGRILLGGEDITGLAASRRASSAVSSAPFRSTRCSAACSVLENVALGIAERAAWPAISSGPPATTGKSSRKPMPAGTALGSPTSAAARERPRLWQSAAGRNRGGAGSQAQSAAARRAGGRRALGEASGSWRRWNAAGGHRASSSSSTTWTWCSASPGASRCWCRARAGRGYAQRDCRNKQVRQVYLGEAGTHEQAAPRSAGLNLERVRAGYGRTIVLEGISLSLAPGSTWRCSGAMAWARPRCSPPSWAIPPSMPAISGSTEKRSATCRPIRAAGVASATCRRSARFSRR